MPSIRPLPKPKLSRSNCSTVLLKLPNSLRDNELRIDGGSGVERVPFLAEKDLPRKETTAGEKDDLMEVSKDNGPAGEEGVGNAASSTGEDSEKLLQLQAMGFDGPHARAALAQSDGDVDLAATLLLSGLDGR